MPLEFISPDAAFAAAAVVKRPRSLLAEALDVDRPLTPRVSTPRSDLAVPAGAWRRDAAEATIAIALDGPMLPVPSWKAAIEVNDPSAVPDRVHEPASPGSTIASAEHGHKRSHRLPSEVVGNRTDWVVRFTGPKRSTERPMRYTFVDGYLIAAPSRALDRPQAIEQRGNGYTLTRSAAFTARS